MSCEPDPHPGSQAPGAAFQRPLQAGRALLRGILQLLYPPVCPGCSAPLGENPDPLCPDCLRRMERADPAAVASCLARLPVSTLDAAFALWVFDRGGRLQQIQHRIKYGNRPGLGEAIGRLMGSALATSPLTAAGFTAVVPVPLHRTRLLERGYNQSRALAAGLAGQARLPLCETLLIRSRATRSQTRLSRHRRWENVSGAFAVRDPESVRDGHFLLVDDVLTTGATATSAAGALKAAGARFVALATLGLARS